MSSATASKATSMNYRTVVFLSIPAILANLTFPLQGIIDAAIIGNLYPADYLSAVGLGAQFFSVVFVSFNFLQYSTTSLNAQAYGRQDIDKMRYILYRALLLSMVIAILIILLRTPLFSLANLFFEATAETEAMMQTYINIRVFGGFFNLANWCFIGWLSSQAQNKRLLIMQLLISVLNVGFNFVLLYFFDLGVAGVAIGTVLAGAIGCGFALYLIDLRFKELGQAGLFFAIDTSQLFKLTELAQVMSLNRDFFIRTTILTLSFAWITRLFSQQSEWELAANIVLINLLYLTSASLDGVVLVTESLVGQAWGRRNQYEFKRAIRMTSVVVVIFALLLAVGYALSVGQFIDAMIDDSEVVKVANQTRYWVVFLPLICVWAYQLDGVFLACAAKTEIRNTVIFAGIIIFPLSYLLEQWYDNNGIWLSIYAFMLLRGGALLFCFPRLTKRLN